ncbi:MAG TPA: hypothetical protein VG122_11075 [Gemmata sp.]|jgi:uncharacterized HAD superfamily protein|nr:hypothetical protein [Gemmata sp.]
MSKTLHHFCIDIDNTIAQTDTVMRKVIADFTKGRVQLDYEGVVTFNYHECPDKQGNRITKEEWKQVHDLFSDPKYLMSVEPMPGAIEGLRRLSENGIVHLATSRLRKARKTTVEWIEHHGFPDHDLHFLRHGEKHAALKEFTAAVEDDYEQAVSHAKIGKTPCFLIRHPWNRNGEPIEDVEWVDDWSKLTEHLLALVSKG